MNNEIIATIVIGIIAVLIVLAMLWAWRARLRRDAGLTAPLGTPDPAEVVARHEVLYVATTRHEQPLERVALSPLVYRARGELALTGRGVGLALDGAPAVFLDAERLVDAGRATVTIDRVVEPGGLIRLVWREDSGTVVDSYLRLAAGDPHRLLPELQRLCADPKNGISA